MLSDVAAIYGRQEEPAGDPPAGETPDFENPPSLVPSLNILYGVFTSLMIVGVAIRLFVRYCFKSWGWDDAACVAAALSSLAYLIMYTQVIDIGYGRHLWDIPESWLEAPDSSALLAGSVFPHPFVLFFAKLSVLTFYLRIFGINSRFRITVYVTIAVIFSLSVVYIALLGASIGRCPEPLEFENAHPFCIAGPFILANAALTVVVDHWLIAMVIPMVRSLQVDRRQKLGIAAIFGMGVLATTASIMRLASCVRQFGFDDPLWQQASIARFTIVEINIAIYIACASTFPAFYTMTRRFFGRASYSIFRKRASLCSSLSSSLPASSGAAREVAGEPESSGSDIVLVMQATNNSEEQRQLHRPETYTPTTTATPSDERPTAALNGPWSPGDWYV